MTISKRVRFEILKRDGFRCRYCGANALSTLLELDHVLPKSKGGSDDPSNLVTACRECNSGKSDVSLQESRLPSATPAGQLQEQAEQIREYLKAQRAVDNAKLEVAEYLADIWREQCMEDPLQSLYNRFVGLAEQYPLQWLVDAIVATGGSSAAQGSSHSASVDRVRYFYGCLRRMRERSERKNGNE